MSALPSLPLISYSLEASGLVLVPTPPWPTLACVKLPPPRRHQVCLQSQMPGSFTGVLPNCLVSSQFLGTPTQIYFHQHIPKYPHVLTTGRSFTKTGRQPGIENHAYGHPPDTLFPLSRDAVSFVIRSCYSFWPLEKLTWSSSCLCLLEWVCQVNSWATELNVTVGLSVCDITLTCCSLCS